MPATLAKRSLPSKSRLFGAFSEPSRLLILEALRERPRTVTEICRMTGLSQPNASNHLACLLGCRIVERESRGRFAFYRLAHPWVEGLLALADEVASSRPSDSCCPICGSASGG